MQFTIFYDSQCPLCLMEMRHLKKHDTNKRIKLVDLHEANALDAYPHINKDKAVGILHGEDENGQLFYGLDVTVLAWRQVNKYRFLGILRWPLLRQFSDLAYRFFARYRELIALLLTGKRRCDSCAIPPGKNQP